MNMPKALLGVTLTSGTSGPQWAVRLAVSRSVTIEVLEM